MTTAAIPLSNDDEAVIHRSDVAVSLSTPDELLEDVYEVARTGHEITTSSYKQIALQFPDDLLADAQRVTGRLKSLCASDVAFYVLGDTSYGSCCVDEVAAEHVNADVVVHYGRSCLSPTSRLPVIYVFGRRPLDVNMLIEKLDGSLSKDAPILVVSDTTYHSSQSAIIEALKSNGYSRVFTNSLNSVPDQSSDSSKSYRISGRTFELPATTPLADINLVYIGPPSPTLTTVLMTYNSLVAGIYSYDPVHSIFTLETTQNVVLRRRYAMVQKARDAGIIGIVVGTLGVSRFLDLIKLLRATISKSGKKSYLFAVGKLNPSKMANFSEIDTFVLVACGENSMVDSKDFYKPIVTPFELCLALRTKPHEAVAWTGEWITDFEQVLSLPAETEEQMTSMDEEAPHFSLVTGQYSSSSKPMYTVLETGVDSDYALQERSTETALSKVAGVYSPAAAHLKNRQNWAGLGTDKDKDQDQDEEQEFQGSVAMTEGRTGVARGYDDFRLS